ncbi:RidA family protein [Nonomuraea lactucae]|uniref:RidA family protein n=1 Tax=Nonomuraea lactucae TaxID=2249762 RepID=UPI000DE26912|nr:RidA family protein [Nonomuraea lactucae]
MSRKTIGTAPATVPLSLGVRKGNILAVAGQIGVGADGEVAGPTVAEQTEQVLANVASVLAEGGAGMDDVVMMRVYLTDTSHFAAMNEVYERAVPAPYPARTTVYVGLPDCLLVEIDALAVVNAP